MSGKNPFYYSRKGDDLQKLAMNGSRLLRKRRLKRAIGEYTRAIESEPNNAVYHGKKAEALCGLGAFSSPDKKSTRYLQAGNEYAKAIELEPSNADYHERREDALRYEAKWGTQYWRKSLYGEAVQEYEEATRLDPNSLRYQNLREAKHESEIEPIAYVEVKEHTSALPRKLLLFAACTFLLTCFWGVFGGWGMGDLLLGALCALPVLFTSPVLSRGERARQRMDDLFWEAEYRKMRKGSDQ